MLTTLATIWVLHVAAMMSPGANVLLVSQLAASDHQANALRAALGITVSAAIWSASAVLGVNAVFSAFPSLRLGLQVVGGVYLLWVANRLWRASGCARPTAAAKPAPTAWPDHCWAPWAWACWPPPCAKRADKQHLPLLKQELLAKHP